MTKFTQFELKVTDPSLLTEEALWELSTKLEYLTGLINCHMQTRNLYRIPYYEKKLKDNLTQ